MDHQQAGIVEHRLRLPGRRWGEQMAVPKNHRASAAYPQGSVGLTQECAVDSAVVEGKN
jgi:hypothetical protein